MKHGAPFVLKQFAPVNPWRHPWTGPRRVRVVYYAYTLESALTFAGGARNQPACWIERRDAPAWKRRIEPGKGGRQTMAT